MAIQVGRNMVTNGRFSQIMLAGLMLSSPAFADYSIQSVQVSSEASVRIKPCEPLFVILDVAVESSGDLGKMREVPPMLAQQVVIGEREYCGRGKGANGAALFTLSKSSIRTITDKTIAFQTVVLLYWNFEDGVFLFDEPGSHRVQFGQWTHVDVIVEKPTQEEKVVVSQMQDMGLEFALFVMEQGDVRAERILSRIEGIVEEHPNTVYSGFLRVCLGICKLRTLHIGRYGKPDFDARAFAQERTALARKYFEEYSKDRIQSPFEAAAAFYLAGELLNQLRFEPAEHKRKIADMRREAKAFLEKVRDSPYSLDYASKAAAKLVSLDE